MLCVAPVCLVPCLSQGAERVHVLIFTLVTAAHRRGRQRPAARPLGSAVRALHRILDAHARRGVRARFFDRIVKA